MPNIEDVCEIVPRSEASEKYVIEIVPKSEEDLSEVVVKLEDSLSEVGTKCDEIEWETVTVTVCKEEQCETVPVCKKEQCETVLIDKHDLCDLTLPKGLEVKPTSLPGCCAMGVFALVSIEKNFHFGPYVGERLELHEKDRASKSEHCWLVSNS